MKPKIIFGCVTDVANEKYLIQALRLLASLRWFGGSARDARFMIYSVGTPPDFYMQQFKEYDAEVHITTRYHDKHGPSNKLRFIEAVQPSECDYIVLLDCDTIIVQDPTPYFFAMNGFAGKPADQPTVSKQSFDQLFDQLDIEKPTMRTESSMGRQAMYPYFNAGVCVFSSNLFARMAEAWVQRHNWCLEHWDTLPYNHFFTDQVSLALALQESKTPINILPLALNFPAHFTPDSYPNYFHQIEPVIIHYHDKTEPDHTISTPPLKAAQAYVARYNDKLTSEGLFHEGTSKNVLFS